MSTDIPTQHRCQADKQLHVAILTISDTRTLENDAGGALIEQMLLEAGHSIVDRKIIIDDDTEITLAAKEQLGKPECQAVLVTGGTGLAARDHTPEAIERLYDSLIPGYGELFRMLSYQEIGAAAMLSRASAGRVGQKIIITMPGSPAGVRLAMERLVIPELPHLVHHAGK